jgi:hypothetical protein
MRNDICWLRARRIIAGIFLAFPIRAGLLVPDTLMDQLYRVNAIPIQYESIPIVTVTSPAQNSKYYTDIFVKGRAADVHGLKDRDFDGTPEIEMSVDGGMPILRDVTDGAWSFIIMIPVDGSWDGSHVLFIKATDVLGQETVFDFYFIIE